MMKKLLVILFVGIFTSIVVSLESEAPIKDNFRNSPPVIEDIPDQQINEDQVFTYQVEVSDADDDDIVFFAPNTNGLAAAEISANGFLTVTPNLNYNGLIEITITVSDGTDTDQENFNLEVLPVNDDPVLNFINSVSFIEDGSETIVVSATDIDSDDLFYSCIPQGANISCIVNTDNIVFSAPADYNGTESVLIKVEDIQGGSDTQNVQVSVIPDNDPPILNNIDDPVEFSEDGSTIINVSASDIDGDNLNYSCDSNFTDIICNVNGNQITFSATPNYNGTDSVTITVQDGNGGSDTQNINVTVTPVNDAPELNFIPNISFSEDDSEDVVLNANDVETESNQLMYDCIQLGTEISCIVNNDQLTITSPPNYNGTESIRVTVSDGELTDSQDVSVTVTSVNDPVELQQEIDDISVDEDSGSITINLADHFYDIEDGVNLNYSLINLGDLGSVISSNIAGTNLTINFIANKHGSGTPTLRACDSNENCYEEQFEISVTSINDVPNLDNIPSPPSSIVINREYSFLVDPSNADVDDNQFNFSITSEPGGGASSLNATENNQYGNFLWYPNTLGNFSITIELTDFNSENGTNGVQSDTYTWDVEVVDANNNNPPEIADINNHNTDEDTIFILPLEIDDPDGNVGELTVNVYDEYTQHISYGTTLETNFENGEWVLTVTPEADWNGDINVIISVSDEFNSANKEFLLTVNPVNDIPSFEFIDECEIEFDEDTAYTYDLYISDIDSHDYYNVTPQETIDYVLTPIGDEIAGELLLGQIVFENETNFYDEANDLNQMTFTPVQDFKGTQVFNLTLTDAFGAEYSQEFIVCITNVNDPPILDFVDNIAFDEDTDSNVLVVNAEDDVVNPLYSDSDPAQFTYECTPYSNNVGCEVTGTDIIFFNVVEHFFGTQDFMITANDGDGGQDSQDITVTVNPINDQPIANDMNTVINEDIPITFNLSTEDVENYDLTYFIVDDPFSPANGDILNNNNGTVTYTPDSDFNGSDTFSFWVIDEDTDSFNNLESDIATVTITVNPVNDPPVLDENNVSSFIFDEDEEDIVNRTFTMDVTDIDENNIFNFTCNPLGLNLSCNVEIIDETSEDGGQANIIITSPQDYNTINGTESVEVSVFDGAGGQDTQTIEIIINEINDAPIVNDMNESTEEDVELLIAFNGTDVDEDDLTYDIITQTNNGLVVNNNDGTATYIPSDEFNGEDSFTYIANDGELDSENPPATVFITVESINDPPVLDVIGSFNFNEDEEHILEVNAEDVDLDILTYLCNPITDNITCSVDGATITFTSPEHYYGIESVDIIVSDGNGGNDSEIVEITIDPVNDAPVVTDTNETTNEDTPITITLNGSDVDGDPLEYILLDLTTNGSIVNNGDSTVTYTPDPEFNGQDSFTYKANDTELDSEDPPAVLTITVMPVDDPPVLDPIDDNNFNEDEDLIFTVSATDLEDDNESLTYGCNTGENLICEVNGNEITLTAPENYNGVESVEIEVFDSFGNSDSQSIVITVNEVNDAPEASDMELVTNEEEAIVITLAGFDLDGDEPLFYSILNNVDNGLLLEGVDTLTVFPTEWIEDGVVTYRPNVDFTGFDDFTYEVNDGELDSDNFGTVTIEVSATNDPPVTDNVSITVLEGQSIIGSFSMFDPDGDVLSASIVDEPFEGSVINNGDGTFTYQAPDNDMGDPGDSFTYNCNDTEFTSNTSTVLITILPSNDDPVLGNILTTIIDEDEPVTIPVEATDEEGHMLTFHCVSGENILCSVDENDSSLITFTSAEEHWNGNETLTIYVTDENGGGLDQYGLPVDVSSQEVVVVILPINDIIETEEVVGQIKEDENLVVDLFDYMINVDNLGDYIEAVDYNIFATGSDGNCVVDNDGIMTYTPDLDFPYTNANSGVDICSFFISETAGPNISDTSFINIEVLPINDDPVLAFISDTSFIEDKSYLIELIASDVDLGDNLTFSCTPSENISCQIKDNILTGTNIVENFFGTEIIIVYVEDEYGGIDSQEVKIEVTFQNDPPQLSQINDIIFNEDESIKVEIQAFDPDPATSLQFSCDNSENIICEVVDESDLENGTYLSYVHFSAVENFNGNEIVLITVDDQFGRAQDSQDVNIIVNPVNDMPVTSNIELKIMEDQSKEINLSDLSSDVDNDILQYIVVENAINGTCDISIDGTLIYTPDEHYPFTNIENGFDSCIYQASDGKLNSQSTVDITILRVNDNPIANDIVLETREDMPVGVLLSDYSEDFDNDQLSYRLDITGKNGNCLYKGDGIVEYIPNPDYPSGHKVGQDTCTYYVDDVFDASSNAGYIYITIEPENDPPVLALINPIIFKEDEHEDGVLYSIDVSATDSEGDALEFSCNQILDNPEDDINIFCDEIILSEDFLSAEISFSNVEHFNGTELVRIIVDDPYKGSDSLDVQVTVIPTPDPPFFINLNNHEFDEDAIDTLLISASDPDIEKSLKFSCEGLTESIGCEVIEGEDFMQDDDGNFSDNIIITPQNNFYGSEDIVVTIIDTLSINRFTVKDTITITINNVDDKPSINSSFLQLNENQIDILNNQISFDEVSGGDMTQFIFNISDPDSLANPDKLNITSQPLGLYFDDLMDIDPNFKNIDLESVCNFGDCTIDQLNDNNVICPLFCNHNFSGHFVQQFIITDTDGLMDTVDVNINVKQVNDVPYTNIKLENNLSSYSDGISITSLQGPGINEAVYFDQTKFFDGNVLTNPNPLPTKLNLDSLYHYSNEINNVIPSYYFIWNRQEHASLFDPDTDPSLNQYPYNLYYRLELINNGIAYVIKDDIDDSDFTGKYAYTLATIDPNVLYASYNKDDLYVPEMSTNPTSTLLENINGGVYSWRIVAQNYSLEDNNKKQSECTENNEFWNTDDGYCMEFEGTDVISYNNSEQFRLDIEYTKGEYHFILNPLDLYVDHYDMYFIPDDQVIVEPSDDYNYCYIHYGTEEDWILDNLSYDKVDELEYFNSSNIFQSIGSFDEFGSIDMFVFTVDEHNNIFINIGNLNYQAVLSNYDDETISSQSGNMYIQFSNDSFEEDARILIYEQELDHDNIFRNEDIISSSLVNITSNYPLESNAWIYFDNQYIDNNYNIDYIKVNQIINNELIKYPTYIDGNNISSEISELGTFILSYNENSMENQEMIPYEFGIKSCYPNPFNPIVSIDYTIDIDSSVKLSIYNILGQKVNVIDYGYQLKGDHTVVWNGTDRQGRLMPSGVYFLEINNNNSKMVKPVTLLK